MFMTSEKQKKQTNKETNKKTYNQREGASRKDNGVHVREIDRRTVGSIEEE